MPLRNVPYQEDDCCTLVIPIILRFYRYGSSDLVYTWFLVSSSSSSSFFFFFFFFFLFFFCHITFFSLLIKTKSYNPNDYICYDTTG